MSKQLLEMSSMEIRLRMKEYGWESEDQLNKDGWVNGYGYSIWFKRWEWHGRRTIAITGKDVCFTKHTNDLNRIDEATRLCAVQALEAYEQYTTSIPCLNADGETMHDLMIGDWNDPRALLAGDISE